MALFPCKGHFYHLVVCSCLAVVEREQTTIYNKPMWEFIGREKKGGRVRDSRLGERCGKRARGGGIVLIRDPLRMRTEPYTVTQ